MRAMSLSIGPFECAQQVVVCTHGMEATASGAGQSPKWERRGFWSRPRRRDSRAILGARRTGKQEQGDSPVSESALTFACTGTEAKANRWLQRGRWFAVRVREVASTRRYSTSQKRLAAVVQTLVPDHGVIRSHQAFSAPSCALVPTQIAKGPI